jgi:hypothetical protein
MKRSILRTIKLPLLCTALFSVVAFSQNVRGLTIGGSDELGFANFGIPSGDPHRLTYVNHLIGMSRVTEEGVNHATPRAVDNHVNSGQAGDLRRVIQVSRPAIVPRLSITPPGGAGGKGVPDGGITAMLLGAALGALGIARRFAMK